MGNIKSENTDAGQVRAQESSGATSIANESFIETLTHLPLSPLADLISQQITAWARIGNTVSFTVLRRKLVRYISRLNNDEVTDALLIEILLHDFVRHLPLRGTFVKDSNTGNMRPKVLRIVRLLGIYSSDLDDISVWNQATDQVRRHWQRNREIGRYIQMHTEWGQEIGSVKIVDNGVAIQFGEHVILAFDDGRIEIQDKDAVFAKKFVELSRTKRWPSWRDAMKDVKESIPARMVSAEEGLSLGDTDMA